MIALVIPTCRPAALKAFLSAWEAASQKFWDALIVTQDDEVPPADRVSPHHYSFRDIERDLRQDSWIISHADSGRRCYGYLVAARLGADIVVTLDDDCYPIPGADYMGGHLAALDRTPRWASSVDNLVPRGLPYLNRGVLDTVKINMGLWTGIPDQDASHQLVDPVVDYLPPKGSRVVPRGQYFPLCGMNLAFRAEAIPLLYFPKQGTNSPYRRFDDIWAGVIAKKVTDHLGWSITVGTPWVEHRKASDPMVNLVKEAPGVALNEVFWEAVDDVMIDRAFSPGDAVKALGRGLSSHDDPYIAQVGKALGIWVGLLGA